MSELKIKTNTRDIILGKFTNTLQVLSGHLIEAKGDMDSGQSYSAKAVYNRLESIKSKLYEDMENLSKGIEIVD